MPVMTFPTSKDIYLEIDGRRVATVQSYKSRATQESRYVEAFGAAEPVGTVAGRKKYVLELRRVAVSRPLDPEVDFYGLDGFNLVAVYPDRKVIYTGCQWSAIDEAVDLADLVYETLTAVASGRLEVR